MTDPSHRHVPEAPEPSGDAAIDEVRADIAATRAELQDTVDALSAKLDVKAQANKKVEAAKDKVADAAGQAKDKAPEPVQHAVEAASPYGKQIAIGAAVLAVVAIIVRRRRRR